MVEDAQTIAMFQFSNFQNLASIVAMLVSLISLLTVFVIYLIFPKLRDVAGKCLLSLVVALFCAQLSYMIATQHITSELFCHTIGALMHFFWLATFLWMNVLALDICITVTQAPADESTSYRFVCYSFYAWLTAAVVAGASVALDFVDVTPDSYKPNYANETCWISHRDAMFYLFALPLGTILLINFILFLITVVCICSQVFSSKLADQRSRCVGLFVVYVLLGFTMGMTWICAFAATLTPYSVLWYVFIVLNALQGLIILVAFVCNRQVYDMVAALNKPTKRQGETAGSSYYACPNGNSRPSQARHGGPFADPMTFRLELESQETSI